MQIENHDPVAASNVEYKKPQKNIAHQQNEREEQQYQQYLDQVEANSQMVIKKIEKQNNAKNEDIEDHDDIEKGLNNYQNQPQQRQPELEPVKNPVSAYMVFVTGWKKENPEQKFNMSHLGELWNSLEPHEKREFDEQYRKRKQKYDSYVTQKLLNNPNPQQNSDVQNRYFFPLHRVKSIMKQDKYYYAKTEAVAAMSKSTEYFGEFFLKELKKISESRNRIDTKDLFQCINVNQRVFGFLDCLIDDYVESNKDNNQQSKKKAAILESAQKKGQKQTEQNMGEFKPVSPMKLGNINQKEKKRGQKPNQLGASNKKLSQTMKGQHNLIDMFKNKQ